MNKKVINIILLLIFLVSLISSSVNAAPRIIEAGLRPIEDFFGGGWQNYEKTVTFIVFFFLFFSAFLIGAKKAFAGELTRSHKVFAFVAAFMSALIIVTTMRFDWINLKYVGWFLIAVLVLFVMYSLLSKIFGKHKFWAFLLALILTALLLWFVWYLIQEGRPLDGLGRISDVFAGFGKGKEKIPGREPLGAGPPIKKEEPGKVKPPVTLKEGWNRNWLWLLILIPIAFGSYVGVKKGISRLKRRREKLGEGKPPKKIEDIIEVLLGLLGRLIRIQEKIMEGFKEKRKHSILTEEVAKKYKFPDNDLAWFRTKENKEYTKEILETIQKLFNDNKGLVEELNEGLKLDVKEMEVLKYLARELQKEEQVLETVNAYYRGEEGRTDLPKEHHREFEIRKELNKKVKSQIVIVDKEMEKYLKQMLAPVLVRLYQLFKEFEEVMVKEQNKALTPLNNTATKLLKEQTGEIKLEEGIKNKLDSDIHKFVTFVKDDEWKIYKNLEKDHDDKAQAKKDLEKEIWKRGEVKEEKPIKVEVQRREPVI